MAVKSGLTLPVILPPSRRMSDAVRDTLRRPLASLRLSVTDPCNRRCRYRMRAIAKSARHADVLEGITAAQQAGFDRLKLNAVVIRGFNDDELADLIEFARAHAAEVRFIEYMDVGGATRWSPDQVVSQREMLDVLARRYGAIEPVHATGDDDRAPAERFRLGDG